MARALPASVFVLLGLGLSAACGGEDPAGTDPEADGGSSGVQSSSSSGASGGGESSSGEAGPPFEVAPCLGAEGEDPGAAASEWVDDPNAPVGGNPPEGAIRATVTTQGADCTRSFSLASTATLRDGEPGNPRQLREVAGRATVQTKSPLFDALYQLALIEAEENQVEAISDWGFNSGNPVGCGAAGCFETGRNWKYVWTRDTAYAADLGLGWVDPARAAGSLDFKLSERRAGGGLEVVQDTGTGGSYPVSSDRVVWSLGATRILLHGAGNVARAHEALANTVIRDRAVVFDERDGLYRGEQSFLDWRENTYPAWAMPDLTHIAASKSLSTNVTHLVTLRFLERTATGDDVARYGRMASALAQAIHDQFWLPEEHQYSTYLTTELDPAPARRFDLLGTSLAILAGIGSEAEGREALSAYPTLPKGPPVIFPQQQNVPIYHNRAIWPFVTAYWMRAAKKVGHDTAYEAAARSLFRGAALNLSNMENLEVVTGTAKHEDGAATGPVVNSQRQLWSVAGYIGMVNENVFGLHPAEAGGLEIAPYVTAGIHRELLGGASSVSLNRVPWHGKTVSVVLRFPAASTTGAYVVGRIVHNGRETGAALAESTLTAQNLIEVELTAPTAAPQPLRVIGDVSDWRVLYAPKTPSVSVSLQAGKLQVAIDPAGETGVTYSVYRDGARVGDLLASTTWRDETAGGDAPSHCYTVESRFANGNVSQRANPACWWGPGAARISTLSASTFQAVGGSLATGQGHSFFQGWGDRGHSLTRTFTATRTGPHLFSTTYANGNGPINTGITCGLKRLVVARADNAEVVASGLLVMPQRGSNAWDSWGESTFVRGTLTAGVEYRVRIVDDESSVNMTDFRHFEVYTGGSGGSGGSNFRVNIAELKVFSLVN